MSLGDGVGGGGRVLCAFYDFALFWSSCALGLASLLSVIPRTWRAWAIQMRMVSNRLWEGGVVRAVAVEGDITHYMDGRAPSPIE